MADASRAAVGRQLGWGWMVCIVVGVGSGIAMQVGASPVWPRGTPTWYYAFVVLGVTVVGLWDLLRRERRHAAALVSIIETSQELGTSASQEHVLSLVAQNVKNLFDCETFVVYLKDMDNLQETLLRVAQAVATAPDAFVEVNPAVKHSVVGEAVTERRPIRVDDFQEDAKEEVIRQDRSLRSLMVSPLMFEDEPIGAMLVARPVRGAYGEAQLKLFALLANQVALAVRNLQLHKTTEKLAVTDSLSGLFTHGFFQDNLVSEYQSAKRGGHSLSMLILDVDFFKKINDTHGHPQGDALLKQLGGLLKESTRGMDVLCRYGGDEFTVTMPSTNRIGAVVVAERIREAVESYEFVVGSKIVHITVSGGVAAYPEDAETARELVEKADTAMLAAKQRGRNRIAFA